MTPLEILRAVYLLLRDPSRWTQRAPARDAKGRPCYGASREAVCWCLVGAVSKCALGPNGMTYPAWREALELLTQATGGAPAQYNDNHEHTDIVAMLSVYA